MIEISLPWKFKLVDAKEFRFTDPWPVSGMKKKIDSISLVPSLPSLYSGISFVRSMKFSE